MKMDLWRKHISNEWFRRKNRFDTEVKGNSEVAHSFQTSVRSNCTLAHKSTCESRARNEKNIGDAQNPPTTAEERLAPRQASTFSNSLIVQTKEIMTVTVFGCMILISIDFYVLVSPFSP